MRAEVILESIDKLKSAVQKIRRSYIPRVWRPENREPDSPVTHQIYLDDGTNVAVNGLGLRQYDGDSWEEIGALGVASVETGTPSPIKLGMFWLDTDATGTVVERIQTIPKTANYTMTDSDDVIECDATSAAFTITIPLSSGRPGKVFRQVKIDSTANAVTVAMSGSDTIYGDSSRVLTNQEDALALMANSTGDGYIIL